MLCIIFSISRIDFNLPLVGSFVRFGDLFFRDGDFEVILQLSLSRSEFSSSQILTEENKYRLFFDRVVFPSFATNLYPVLLGFESLLL